MQRRSAQRVGSSAQRVGSKLDLEKAEVRVERLIIRSLTSCKGAARGQLPSISEELSVPKVRYNRGQF